MLDKVLKEVPFADLYKNWARVSHTAFQFLIGHMGRYSENHAEPMFQILKGKYSQIPPTVGPNNTLYKLLNASIQGGRLSTENLASSLIFEAKAGRFYNVQAIFRQNNAQGIPAKAEYFDETADMQCGLMSDSLEGALLAAAKGGHLDIVQEIFLHPNANEISPDGLGFALEAVQSGHFGIIQMIFRHPNASEISPDSLGYSLGVAAKNGCLSIVIEIFNHPNAHRIVAEGYGSLGFALEVAAQAGHLDIVQMILSHPNASGISEESLGYALVAASGDDCLEIRNAILRHPNAVSIPTMFGDKLGNLLVDVAKAGNLEGTNEIFNHPYADKITPSKLRYSLSSALKAGHFEIIALILNHPNVQKLAPNDFGRALKAVVKAARFDIAHRMLSHPKACEIPAVGKYSLNSVSEAASKAGHDDIVQALRAICLLQEK